MHSILAQELSDFQLNRLARIKVFGLNFIAHPSMLKFSGFGNIIRGLVGEYYIAALTNRKLKIRASSKINICHVPCFIHDANFCVYRINTEVVKIFMNFI